MNELAIRQDESLPVSDSTKGADINLRVGEHAAGVAGTGQVAGHRPE